MQASPKGRRGGFWIDKRRVDFHLREQSEQLGGMKMQGISNAGWPGGRLGEGRVGGAGWLAGS